MRHNATNLIVTRYRPYIDDTISYRHIAQHYLRELQTELQRARGVTVAT